MSDRIEIYEYENVLWFSSFSIIILITQTYKQKNITIISCYCIFPVTEKKEKNKLKTSEKEVKTVIKMKRHNLCSNCQKLA